MTSVSPILIKNRIMKPHKASVYPDLSARNVLTNSHWDFVELWLKRNGKDEALFYWSQSRAFNKASVGLPNQSAPLLHYYSFMNAAKALLSSRGITFGHHHGVSSAKGCDYNNSNLSTTGVFIKTHGIVPSISSYFGDEENESKYNLQDLFANLPYIHRTYCLTYHIDKDIFIPIKNAKFVYDSTSGKAYLNATLSKDFSYEGVEAILPSSFQLNSNNQSNGFDIRSTYSHNCNASVEVDLNALESLGVLHKKVRGDLFYINGAETLWYIKGVNNIVRNIKLSPITITLAAMHRLSELSRYDPFKLDSFLQGEENWILAEFIQQSPAQFIDEISSEITGHQFLIPNVRAAN